MPASFVLASLKGSTYRSVRLASSLAAAALDGLFEQPAAAAPSGLQSNQRFDFCPQRVSLFSRPGIEAWE
jgi:hypothetical protein